MSAAIAPPTVTVNALYPGATAEEIADTVAAPLEQQINGVERMLYMQSTSTGSGTVNLTVTFDIGTNPDQNAINVNNRVQRALPLLPAEVARQGLTVQKRSTSILQVLKDRFKTRLYDSIEGGGAVTLFIDGSNIYARTDAGEMFSILEDAAQPLMMMGEDIKLRQLIARERPARPRAKDTRPSGKRGASRP